MTTPDPRPWLLAPLLACAIAAQDAPRDLAPLERAARGWLEEQRAAHGFPGACAAFVLPGGEVGAVAAGSVVAAEGEDAVPLTTRHKIFSGSIGKTYVAAVALQLAGAGELDLDAKVARYLGEQEWFAAMPNAEGMTVRMLLQHRSGVPEHVWKEEFQAAVHADVDKEWSAAELCAFVAGDEPMFAPDEGFSYADTNYVLVGAVLEQVTGEPWYELLRARLLRPLGLDETVPSAGREIEHLAGGMASGIAFTRGPTVADGRFVVNPQFEWCGGGVCSTTRDLARWCRALFRGDVVPAALRAEMVDGREAPRVGGRYGLGVIVRDTAHGPAFGHTGVMIGCLSAMFWYPDHELAVALQWNTDDGRRLGAAPHRRADELAAVVLEAAGKR